MRLLLDTHIFLWFINGDKRLSSSLIEPIRDGENDVYLSVASLWECVIKYDLGKLPLPDPPHLYLPAQRRIHQIESLIIDEGTISHLPSLPALHRDPFDRLLVCQALQHNLTLMTTDAILADYPIPILP